MKHFLRKLHIGGNREDQAVEGGRSQHDPSSAASSSSSSASPLSGLADWLSSFTKHEQQAARGRSDSSSSRVAATEGSTAATAATAAAAAATTAVAKQSVTAPGSGYESLEEEYQVQLAIALSVSDDQPDDPEIAEIEAVKRISLGLGPAPVSTTQAELAAYRYWAYNALDYDDRVLNGFYDVYGVVSDPTSYPKKLPALVDLQGEPVSSMVTQEVVLVNRATDYELVKLEKAASLALAECSKSSADPLRSGLAQKIAKIVADQMGGAVDNDVDMLAVWRTTSLELRSSFQSNVLPLGYLQIGLARHRALLFKVLADVVGIPCRLVKGRQYTGVDEGAVNTIKDVNDREYIIDLMGAPGALIPPDGQADEKTHAVQAVSFGQRHHSEPVELEQAMAGSERRPGISHVRSPSWTEGIGAPGILRQSKAKDMSQYMIDAAKENPGLAQKLHDVLLESGLVAPPEFLAELSPRDVQQNNNSTEARRKAPRVVKTSKDKGKPPLVIKPSFFASPDDCAVRERPQRLKSVEGLGDRRPLETTPVSLAVDSYPVTTAASVLTAVQENFPANLIRNSPVAASAITAAVVASSMVVAAAKSDGEANLEVPITAAATATAAVVAATSAAVVLKSESGSGNSDGSGDKKKKADESSASSSGEKAKKSSGTDGEDEKARSPGQSYSVMQDVAEWEIPWEQLAVCERIGIGSYGEVYRGDWRGTAVAVKKFLDQDISGDALEEFITEVRLMKRMRHPNVVLFMGAVTRQPDLSIVTEFLPRGSLYKLLHRSIGKLDERRRLRMALDVAKGMNYLHTSTPIIVHRDLKSPNLLVDRNWVVKVCDFGLSRIKHHTFLSSKSQAGTPEWMAPEVLRNEPSNEKADVYSFGVILWELATQQQPWHGMNPMQVVGAVGFQNRRLDIPPEVDPAIAKIIQDCWHNDPHLRPSFTDIMRSLRPFQKPVIPSQADIGKQKAQQQKPQPQQQEQPQDQVQHKPALEGAG